jgi:hypothetical protein
MGSGELRVKLRGSPVWWHEVPPHHRDLVSLNALFYRALKAVRPWPMTGPWKGAGRMTRQ